MFKYASSPAHIKGLSLWFMLVIK